LKEEALDRRDTFQKKTWRKFLYWLLSM
jgi:hypothetical protein